MRRIAAAAACVLVVLILLGCGGFQQMAADQAQRKKNLQEIGAAYHKYWDQNPQKAPDKAADLEGLLATAEAKAALADGSVVVNYGITAKEMHALGGPYTVLAYEKGVPTGDGFVVDGNATVKHMTAGQLAGMQKPK